MSEIARPTRTHLAQWKRLAEEATEGPWEAARNRPVSGSDFYSVDAGDEIVASPGLVPDRAGPQASADVDFIAASRQAVPALIAEVEALRAERDRARGHLRQAMIEVRGGNQYAETLDKRAEQAESERDKALARIEKVRALLDEAAAQAGVIERNILGGVALRPNEIRRALDGGEEET